VCEQNPDTSSSLSSSDPKSSNVVQQGSCPSDSDMLDDSEPPTVQKRSNPEMQFAPFREESPNPSVHYDIHLLLPPIPSVCLHPPPASYTAVAVEPRTPSDLQHDIVKIRFAVVRPFFGCSIQTPRELTPFDRLAATTIKILWDLSHGTQAGRCNVRRDFKHCGTTSEMTSFLRLKENECVIPILNRKTADRWEDG